MEYRSMEGERIEVKIELVVADNTHLTDFIKFIVIHFVNVMTSIINDNIHETVSPHNFFR